VFPPWEPAQREVRHLAREENPLSMWQLRTAGFLEPELARGVVAEAFQREPRQVGERVATTHQAREFAALEIAAGECDHCASGAMAARSSRRVLTSSLRNTLRK
jgi:hypothetical protein